MSITGAYRLHASSSGGGGSAPCPTCGGCKLEHTETRFKTLEEAIPNVARLNGVKRVEN
jgi:hypothetical protein